MRRVRIFKSSSLSVHFCERKELHMGGPRRTSSLYIAPTGFAAAWRFPDSSAAARTDRCRIGHWLVRGSEACSQLLRSTHARQTSVEARAMARSFAALPTITLGALTRRAGAKRAQ